MQLTTRAAVTLALAAAWSGAVYAQGLRLVTPKAPTPSPVIAPQPRARVPVNPSIIFRNLMSESSANRRLGLSQPGWTDIEKYAEDREFSVGMRTADRFRTATIASGSRVSGQQGVHVITDGIAEVSDRLTLAARGRCH